MKKVVFLISLMICYQAQAEDIFAKADLAAGKALLEKNCISCHDSSYGGDGSGIYTREFRKIKTAKGLVAQVRACNTNLDLKWFEEDELNVAAYLNHQYYALGH